MKNRFLEKPTEDNIKEIGECFYLRNAVIALDWIGHDREGECLSLRDTVLDCNDVKEIMADTTNTIVLTGKATGNNRLADAIEDAVLHTCSVADGYDLFSADKVLLYIVGPKSNPMLMSETESVSTFMEMFPHATMWRWGLAEKNDISDMRVMIVASNLKKERNTLM